MAPEKFIEDQYLSKAIGVGSNEDASTHLKNMGIDFTNSKPESVVAFFVRAMTEERDIVLDFFIGSGTTAAVSHKMNRQYIAVDQMDYIETETIKRMNLVIQGEQGGISQALKWTPQNPDLLDGDKYAHNSFVYCELAQANQQLVDEIMAANEPFKLQEVWALLQERGFLSYKVSPKMINEHAEDFNDLSLEDQKRFLIECLDKNMLYIPYSDIDDEGFTLSENDKQLTRQFYASR
jgi:adenine-specific DNA-methyltransferase